MHSMTLDSTRWKPGRILITRLLAACLAVTAVLSHHVAETCSVGDFVLAGLGLLLILWCIEGRIWSSIFIGGRKTEELGTHGPYALCRNPLYFYSWLGAIGIACATGMVSVIVSAAFVFWLVFHLTIRAEERNLLRLHGAEYLDYCQNIPRFFPPLRASVIPSTYHIYPDRVRQTIAEARWFLFGWVLMLIIHLLHAERLFPPLLSLR